MKVFARKGVMVQEKSRLLIDGNSLKEKVILTHAHSDHANPKKNRKYFASPETISLLEKSAPNSEFVPMHFHKKMKLDEFVVSLVPSGHILGSAQVLVEDDSRLVVSSDFKLQKTILSEPAEIIPSDLLLIESTFGIPKYSFPSREKVYEEMISWVNNAVNSRNFVVLGGYSIGKAQELTAVSSLLCNETPLVFKKIFEANKVYESHGINLGDFIELKNNLGNERKQENNLPDEKQENNLDEANVLVMPLQMISDEFILELRRLTKKNISVAIASGWKNSKFKSFPLSDHADFNQLLDYVKFSAPKKVLAYHGFSREFASYVQRRLGIPAMHLREFHQSNLMEFD